jgi:hypothetical protein
MKPTRVWRQLRAETVHARPCTPAAQSMLRLALAMVAGDVRAEVSREVRVAILARLQCPSEGWTPLTAAEVAAWRGPVLAYMARYYARSYALVAQAFAPDEPAADA